MVKPFCKFCEQRKNHPTYVFLATSDSYERIARSKNPLKAVEEFKASKGFVRAKGFPRSVRRSHWKLRMFFGPFPNGVAARKFKRAWQHGDAKDMTVVQKEFKVERYDVEDLKEEN